jgi:hypothetical protein
MLLHARGLFANVVVLLLQTVLDEATTAWGIKVERVEM